MLNFEKQPLKKEQSEELTASSSNIYEMFCPWMVGMGLVEQFVGPVPVGFYKQLIENNKRVSETAFEAWRSSLFVIGDIKKNTEKQELSKKFMRSSKSKVLLEEHKSCNFITSEQKRIDLSDKVVDFRRLPQEKGLLVGVKEGLGWTKNSHKICSKNEYEIFCMDRMDRLDLEVSKAIKEKGIEYFGINLENLGLKHSVRLEDGTEILIVKILEKKEDKKQLVLKKVQSI